VGGGVNGRGGWGGGGGGWLVGWVWLVLVVPARWRLLCLGSSGWFGGWSVVGSGVGGGRARLDSVPPLRVISHFSFDCGCLLFGCSGGLPYVSSCFTQLLTNSTLASQSVFPGQCCCAVKADTEFFYRTVMFAL